MTKRDNMSDNEAFEKFWVERFGDVDERTAALVGSIPGLYEIIYKIAKDAFMSGIRRESEARDISDEFA